MLGSIWSPSGEGGERADAWRAPRGGRRPRPRGGDTNGAGRWGSQRAVEGGREVDAEAVEDVEGADGAEEARRSRRAGGPGRPGGHGSGAMGAQTPESSGISPRTRTACNTYERKCLYVIRSTASRAPGRPAE